MCQLLIYDYFFEEIVGEFDIFAAAGVGESAVGISCFCARKYPINAIANPRERTLKLIPIICTNPYDVGKNGEGVFSSISEVCQGTNE